MSHDAERAIVSALLLEPSAARTAVTHVAPDDFQDSRLGRLYGLILGMVGSGNRVDAVLIREEVIRRRAESKDNTWLSPSELVDLLTGNSVPSLVEQYARVVRDDSVRRQATVHLTRAYQALTAGADPGPVIADTLTGLKAVRDGSPSGDLVARMLGEVLAESDSYEWVIPGLLERGDRFVITGGEGAGKALALDTPLATPTGWRTTSGPDGSPTFTAAIEWTTMGEVKVGDYVFGADGSPTLVTAATEVMLDHECYRVEFSDGTHIVADRDHQWAVKAFSWRSRKVMTTGQIAAAILGREPFPYRLVDSRWITAVLPVESVPVRCISVDAPDHLFLAGRQMVPTHNSTLVRQIAVCSAAGVHPFTLAPIRPLSVLVVDAENSERQWRRNARAVVAQARKRGQEDPETRVHLACTRRLDVTSERDLGAVHRLMDEHDPDMVVIGPLYKLVPRAITNDDDAAPLITALDSLRDRGVALVMEAHAGHGQSVPGQRDLRPRGSSALLGWPEFGFGLQLDKDQPHQAHLIRWRGDRDERDWPDTLERGGEFQWSIPRWSPSRGVA